MFVQIKASAMFPLRGADWPRKLLIGGATGLLLELVFVGLAYLVSEEAAFGIAPLAVAVNLPAIGYVVRVYAAALRRDAADLPEWEGWPGLFAGGLVVFSIGLAYGIIPLLFLLIGLGLLVKGGIILFLGMVLMVLGVLAGMFTLFFVPIGLAGYLARRRLEAAFHPATLWGGINAVLTEYVPTYVLSVGLFIAAGMLAAVPYLGPIIWPFLWFYLLLFQARLFGDICGKAM
jgi:small basic protein